MSPTGRMLLVGLQVSCLIMVTVVEGRPQTAGKAKEKSKDSTGQDVVSNLVDTSKTLVEKMTKTGVDTVKNYLAENKGADPKDIPKMLPELAREFVTEEKKVVQETLGNIKDPVVKAIADNMSHIPSQMGDFAKQAASKLKESMGGGDKKAKKPK